ncbi:hypothetical protein M413DRAFT_379456 [Hebeloma cylindrosporum]|uniref:F-box domain-containing protein n=1 Tax=Hebeloma cylindrosporum TaxID=76867 RepID=A0A0C3CJR8_HEBCY|nr:hypothetical protein M413DRAFT_379456 [Hebeloma cylindrosporum h7]
MAVREADSPFLSLAPELIQAIADALALDTAKNLRLTCKQFGEFLNPRLFRELTISFSLSTYEKDLAKVRILATTDCHAASSGTQMLKIASVSPAYNPVPRAWKLVDDEWVMDPGSEVPPEIRAAEEELKKYLFKAIASLKNVQSVEWKPGYKDGDWAQIDVMNALKTLPNLRVIILHASLFKVPPSLQDLSNIQKISACDVTVQHTPGILDNISKLVAQSPKLTSIDMTGSARYAGGKCASLHDIFKHYPQGFPPLQLQRLSLEYYLVKLDEVTLPHLRHLTSLNLMYIEEPFGGRRRWGTHEPSGSESSEGNQTYGSTFDDIWEALKISGIYLQELALDIVVPSFLEYLASYSGLKKLRLIPGGFDEGDSSDSMANQFFSAPLTNHVQSLEYLSISALYEGSWCFGPWNQAIVSRCTNLKALEMAITSRSIEDVDSKGNMIGRLLDTVSDFMPKLERLIILTADLEAFRDAMCGNPSMDHAASSARAIITSVKMYRSLPTCHRLPHLTVVDDPPRTFIPLGPDESGRLHYTDTKPSSRDDDLSSQDDDLSSLDDDRSFRDGDL